jgi:hypothetical protein
VLRGDRPVGKGAIGGVAALYCFREIHAALALFRSTKLECRIEN